MNSATSTGRRWEQYPISYRAREIKTIAEWIGLGESGAVAGLIGTGRATLLGFLCHRPDALARYLKTPKSIALIPVDLNNLPESNLATLYRTILRSFFEVREGFPAPVQEIIQGAYRRCEGARDPFLPQSALRELLLFFQSQETRVALVLNRFDRFCRAATPQMTGTLRGLRDSFRETLCYVMGMREEVAYLSDLPAVEPLRGILDTHLCWVGPLEQPDARFMISREMTGVVSEAEMIRLLALTGGYPSLVRVTCHWWKTAESPLQTADWQHTLLPKLNVQHRLNELWSGLTQEEQAVLAHLQKTQTVARQSQAEARRVLSYLEIQRQDVLHRLRQKGVCRQNGQKWQIVGELFAVYIATTEGRGYGRIWQDEETGHIYQGPRPVVGLPPLEGSILSFFIKHPKIRHSHDEIIEACWPEDVKNKEAVSNDSVYQAIRGIRKVLEPNIAKPCYVVNWRGQREGGYQFFPEGKPE